jgi:diguanylate cyclase (GGDEF)-like protein
MDRIRKQERRWLIDVGLVSLVLMAVAAILLGHALRGDIRERVISGATSEAQLVGRIAIDRQLGSNDLDKGLASEQIGAIDRALAEVPTGNQINRVIARNRAYKVVYAGNHDEIGRQDAASRQLEAALAGRIAWRVADGALAVSVPVRNRSDAVVGSADIRMPYAPIAAQIKDGEKELYLRLILGFVVLYLLLLAVIAVASRALRRRASHQEQQASRDALTNLPNRAAFREVVKKAAKSAQRKKRLAAVMVMDLDRFKEVNDTLGHFHGDIVLQRIGSRLQNMLRPEEVVARMGGDEFAIVLPDIEDPQLARRVAKRILKSLEDPISVSGLALQVEASIGIAIFPSHGDNVDSLLRAADVAMYVAKEERSGFEFYAVEDHQHDASSLALVGEMRRAMDAGELVLHYQPKLDTETGDVRSVEALARWQHPERGMLAPDEFIPLAEHSNLLRPVTLYLIETAARQCRAWHSQGHELSVAVNLSVVNLLDLQLPVDLGHVLSEARLEPQYLELEITESTIMKDPRRALEILTRLSDMGIKLSIDDFGTGYSSLAYLKQLPVDAIKIDKSFVLTMAEDPGNATIVQSTIDLGHNLGLKVVAEGVEEEESYARLAELGCDIAQGYFLSRPLAPEKLSVWLEVFSSAPEAEEAEVEAPSDEDAQLQEWLVA